MADVQEWMTGIVASSNPKGVKLQGEDEYHNWSKHGTPAEAERPVPRRGQKVRLGLDKDGFIRDMQDENRNPLRAGVAAGPSSSSGFTDDDKRRMTILSCLRSAAALMANVPMPEAQEGQPAPKITALTMRVAKAWAKEVAPELFEPREGAEQ